MDNDYCCWNIKNMPWVGHNTDCLAAYGPQYRPATLKVTFADGVVMTWTEVMVCINRPDNDGLRINGTRLDFETEDGGMFTLLGVRHYSYELGEDDTL